MILTNTTNNDEYYGNTITMRRITLTLFTITLTLSLIIGLTVGLNAQSDPAQATVDATVDAYVHGLFTATAQAQQMATQLAQTTVFNDAVATTFANALTATAIQQAPANTPVAQHADWQPIIRDFDGVPMVLVPVGCFDMGSITGADDEQPVHTHCFETPFWIDRYEVAQADFTRLRGIKAQPSGILGPDLPVTNITWFEARDFCALRGARLPYEGEWEYAARGPEALIYPWGNDFDGERVNYQDADDATWLDGYQTAAPVAAFPQGASWVGAEQLAGNVWEWTSSAYAAYPYIRTDGRQSPPAATARHSLRGGSWQDSAATMRAANRSTYIVNEYYITVGFRCVRDNG